ncbi:MAG: glutamine-hydrolyzing GMP synthase [Bacteroidota bacterium]|nr:glutamine-hydrolyzing GMP synthase [Bacteroidota bacterium]
MEHRERIVVLDFGSQYTQLIARRIRESGVYAEIVPYSTPASTLRALAPQGIVLSGGPASVYEPGAPYPDPGVFELGVPILGICYGLQLLGHLFGGEVIQANRREYGRAELHILDSSDLFAGIPSPTTVWMSHGDALSRLPEGFERIGYTENAPIAAIRYRERQFWGVQFHPEVEHTPYGRQMLENFARRICGCRAEWTPAAFIEAAVEEIRRTVNRERVLCALSGGVDSTVTAVLVHRAIGDRLHCIHVDTGLMREGESQTIADLFQQHFRIPLTVVDGSELFLSRLRGVVDPELKRRIIGHTFIELFEREAQRFPDARWLAQGTLYPDVIESTSVRGPSATIKTHHNVGGLPERMQLKLLEPLRELFKDEVRAVGRELGIPEGFLRRHPFPGPGLAIRVLGEVTLERLTLLRRADAIFVEELQKAGLYDSVWQAFAVLLPVQSVGVMGDERTYEYVCALRAVTSTDGMTADWARLPEEFLAAVANRIINEVRGINRVVYDISSKPPATIEWE